MRVTALSPTVWRQVWKWSRWCHLLIQILPLPEVLFKCQSMLLPGMFLNSLSDRSGSLLQVITALPFLWLPKSISQQTPWTPLCRIPLSVHPHWSCFVSPLTVSVSSSVNRLLRDPSASRLFSSAQPILSTVSRLIKNYQSCHIIYKILRLRVKFLLKFSYLRYSTTFFHYYVLSVGTLKCHCVLGLTAL